MKRLAWSRGLMCLLLSVLLSPAIASAQTADELVAQGKSLLADHDIEAAHQTFLQALGLDPDHAAANFFYAATRLARLKDFSEVQDFMDAFGVEAEGRDIYDWEAELLGEDAPGRYLTTRPDGLFLHAVEESRYGGSGMQDGTYTFTLTPREGAPVVAQRQFTRRELDLPVPSSPQDGASWPGTAPVLQWTGPDGYYYRVVITPWYGWSYYYGGGSAYIVYTSPRTLNAKSVTIPNGVLAPDSAYQWRVEIWDGPSDETASNYRSSATRRFTTQLSAAPGLDSQHVVRELHGDGSEYYSLGVRLVGIAPPLDPFNPCCSSLQVTLPGGLPLSYALSPQTLWNGVQIYSAGPLRYPTFSEGLYTFTCSKAGQSPVSRQYSYVRREVPVPVPSSPADGSKISSTQPVFRWEAAQGNPHYRIEIRDWGNWLNGDGSPYYSSSGPRIIYTSPRLQGQTTAAVPAGLLQSDASYVWRVEAWDRGDSDNPSNFGVSDWQKFTVQPAGTAAGLDHVGLHLGRVDQAQYPYPMPIYIEASQARVLGLSPDEVGWLEVTDPNGETFTKLDPNFLPPDTPSIPGSINPFLQDTLIPEIDGALENLSRVSSEVNEILDPDVLKTDDPVEIDYGEVLLFRCGLHGAKAAIHQLREHNLDVDVDEILNRIEQEVFLVQQDLLDNPEYPHFLELLEDGQEYSERVRQEVLQGIELYLEASDFVRSEEDPQDDDLVSIEDEDLEDEALLRDYIRKGRKSILDPPVTEFVNEICRDVQVDMASFFANPPDRGLLPAFDEDNEPIQGTFPDPTFYGVFPLMTEQEFSAITRDAPDIYIGTCFGVWPDMTCDACWDVVPEVDFLRYEVYRNGQLVETVSDRLDHCRSIPYDSILGNSFQVFAFYADGTYTCGETYGYVEDLAITTDALPPAGMGSPYEEWLHAAGGIEPYRWALLEGDLPTGLTLIEDEGRVTGIPQECGSFPLTVRVQDSDTDRNYDTRVLSPLQVACTGDSDHDGLSDEIEVGTGTDPLDADSDEDGIIDGGEDLDLNGAKDANETDPRLPDTDGDQVWDGTETGVTLLNRHPDTNYPPFVPDRDPGSRTDPLVPDTDGDCIDDGEEDLNRDGRLGQGETDPVDLDTDDDGLADGVCGSKSGADLPRDPNPTLFDSDGDGLSDGVELGVTTPVPDPDGDGPLKGTDPAVFVGDQAPGNTTDPLNPDQDGDGALDGEEDIDHNGRVDEGESDPLNGSEKTILLNKGLNLLAYNLLDADPTFSSYDLAERLGPCVQAGSVMRYEAGVLETNEFPIDAGTGLLIMAGEACRLVVRGTPVECQPAPALPALTAGFNLVAFPCEDGARSSHNLLLALAGEGKAVTAVQRLDEEAGAFETTVVENSQIRGPLFPIRRGQGYILYLGED